MQRFGGKFIHGFQNPQFLHGFQRLLLHSSANSEDSFANYLVSSLGFSHKQALSTSTKLSNQCRKLYDTQTGLNAANSVVAFFKNYGFDETLITKIVSSNPKLLYCKVDKTLKPKFDFFTDEGFSRDDVIQIISENSNILFMGLDSTIAPLVQFFRRLMNCDVHVISVLMKLKNGRFGPSMVHYLLPNVELLTSYGISIELIRKHMLRLPLMFFRKPDTFRIIVNRVEKKLRISRDSPLFMYGIYLASSLSEKTIESKYQMFKSFGWTQTDVDTLMLKNLFCFTLSNEGIKKKLDFLMNELRFEPAYLVSCTNLLTSSLEKRILPRHEVLQILKAKGSLEKSPSLA